MTQSDYWQQEVNYKIDVALDDSLHTLKGILEIEYVNNSPDTLSFIYFHFWANAFSSDNTAYTRQNRMFLSKDFYYSKSSQRGYVSELDFSVDKVPARLVFDAVHPDIAQLHLPKLLLPEEKISIKTPFFVKIPFAFSRLGHIGQSYYITQWYPKPAVYDQEGWHPMPYLDIGEFYSEFGSFDVRITLPEEYFVAATGQLHTESEKNRINQRIEASKLDSLPFLSENIKSGNVKTLHFTQDNVHDFAWFADKNFLIDRSSIKLPTSENFVETYAYYHAENRQKWSKAVDYLNHSVWFFSDQIGHYPYSHCTAVEGLPGIGGGMEYPMITLIGESSTNIGLERVIIHEVAHNWFYGILGFNERKYPWLDEGFTSFYENEYMKWKYPHQNLVSSQMDVKGDFSGKIFGLQKLSPDYLPYIAVQYLQSRNIDSKMNLASDEMSPENYFIQTYLKPIPLLKMLQQSMGSYHFKEIMNDFYSDYKFTHPSPQIVQYHFETESNNNLSWLFNDIIKENKRVDYSIVSLKRDKQKPQQFTLKLKNKTRTKAPYSISLLDKNNNEISKTWHQGFEKREKLVLSLSDSVRKIVVNDGFQDIEINKTNNSIRTKGLFRKQQFPSFHFLYSASKLDRTPVFWTPSLGYNVYNSWMPGILLYSDPIILRNFDYVINPMWSFKANTWVGNGDIGYLFKPKNSTIAGIRLGVDARKYNYKFANKDKEFSRVSPKIEVFFKDITAHNIQSKLEFKHYFVNQGVELYYRGFQNEPLLFAENIEYQLSRVRLDFDKKHKIQPQHLVFDMQFNNDVVKASVEYNYTYYYKKKSSFECRIFAGQIFNDNTFSSPNYKYRADGMSASSLGSNDYLFEHTFVGRSEQSGLWKHQMYIHEGGFKMPTPLGVADWIIAFNTSVAIPNVPVLRVFADIATYEGVKSQLQNDEIFIYEAGLQFRIIKDVLEVYVPLLISNDLKRVNDLNNKKYSDRIRFVLNLEAVNVFKNKMRYHKLLM